MLTLGIAGVRRNAAAALCESGRVLAACEQERLTRTRHIGLSDGALPREAVDAVLQIAGRSFAEPCMFVAAEAGARLPGDRRAGHIDHHHAHAATAFYTSPFPDAAILVCDRHGLPDLSVWRADTKGLTRVDLPWVGPGVAAVYSMAAKALGFINAGQEYRLEALARIADHADAMQPLAIAFRGDGLEVCRDFQATLHSMVAGNGHAGDPDRLSLVAQAVQGQLGLVLLEIARVIRGTAGSANLCLAGGLFYNSYFTTLLAGAGLFQRTFVPVNPGNAGVAVGAALMTSSRDGSGDLHARALSPFLGPAYSPEDVKLTFDNCKLSYDYLRDGQVVEQTVDALAAGKLVGWFQGRMEWGPRALGNRSILASPFASHVLENLNGFLKHREPYRCYSVAVCEEDAARYFDGPPTSRFMEFDYEVRDRDLFARVLPGRAARLRVQTVLPSAGVFHRLLRAFGDATGVPVVVNTSYNGFNEPMVCSPRDAVRVFYGTGLDMAVIGNLVLRK